MIYHYPNFIEQWFSNLSVLRNPQRLVKTQLTGPYPQSPWWRISISTSSQVVLMLFFPSHTLRTAVLSGSYCSLSYGWGNWGPEKSWYSQGPAARKHQNDDFSLDISCTKAGAFMTVPMLLAVCFFFPRETNRFLPVFYFSSVSLPREPWDHLLPFISLNQSNS